MSESLTFGGFIKDLRSDRNLTLSTVSSHLGISISYLSDIEKGHRSSLGSEKLDRLSELFELNEKERRLLLDLSSFQRQDLPFDVKEYMLENKESIEIIRKFQDKNLKNKDLEKIKTILK